jgi:hypothetical protein
MVKRVNYQGTYNLLLVNILFNSVYYYSFKVNSSCCHQQTMNLIAGLEGRLPNCVNPQVCK